MIERKLYKSVLSRLEQFPAVALMGPSQVGKTTLAQEIADGRASVYLDLEDPSDRRKLSDVRQYVDEHEDVLVVFDEIHRIPELFQVLRGSIDRGRRKGIRTGRFLFLGSASMRLLKQEGESLAGRIAYVDLPVLNILEISHEDKEKLWVRGGFPDSFFAESDQISMKWRKNFINTYLERDIPVLGPRISAETLYRFWTMLAYSQGEILNSAQLARDVSVDGKTITRYLDLFVDLLLVRRLQPLFVNAKKRLVKSPKVYVRDSGVVHTLLEIQNKETLLGHPIVGASWEGFVIENLLSITNRGVMPSFYRTSTGAEINLVLEFAGFSEKWAIAIKIGLAPRLTKGFYYALEDVKPDKTFVVYAGDERYSLAEGIDAIGLTELCQILAKKVEN